MPQGQTADDILKQVDAALNGQNDLLKEVDAALAAAAPKKPAVPPQQVPPATPVKPGGYRLPVSGFGAGNVQAPLGPVGQVIGGTMGGGIAQMMTGARDVTTGSGAGRVAGAADVLEGAMQAGMPTLLPAVITAPVPTLAGLVVGIGGQQAIETVAAKYGLKSPWVRLTADLAGLAAGMATGVSAEKLIDRFWRSRGVTPPPAKVTPAATKTVTPKVEAPTGPAKPVKAPRPSKAAQPKPQDLLAEVDAALQPTSPESLQHTTAQAGQTTEPAVDVTQLPAARPEAISRPAGPENIETPTPTRIQQPPIPPPVVPPVVPPEQTPTPSTIPVPTPESIPTPATPAEAPVAVEGGLQAVTQLQPREMPQPGEYYTVDPKLIKADPARFQFKGHANAEGVTPEARIEEPWNEKRAGSILAWRDPATGELFVVNGHHRLDAAKRSNAKRISVRVLEDMTPEEAMAEGAYTNISEDKGSPVDVARVIRSHKLNNDELRARGINPRTGLAKQGNAIAQLSEPLFVRTAMGEIDPSVAAVVGESGLSPEGQFNVIKIVESQEAKGKELTPRQLRAFIEDVKSAPELKASEQAGPVQPDIFGRMGEDEPQLNLALERAKLRDWMIQQFTEKRRHFSAVANAARAAVLSEEGNVINVEGNVHRVAEARDIEKYVNDLANKGGPVRDALNNAVERLARGENEDTVKKELITNVKNAIEQEIRRPPGGAAPPGRAGAEPPDTGGGTQPSRGGVNPEPIAGGPTQASGEQPAGGTEGVEPPDDSQGQMVFSGFPIGDLVDVAKGIVQNLIKGGIDLSGRMSPKKASPAGARTSSLLRDTFADIANAEDVRRVLGRPDKARFEKQTDAANIALISEYERTGTFPGSENATFTKHYQDSLDQAHAWLEQAFGKDTVGYIENYVRHAFTFKNQTQAQQAVSVLQGRIRGSLSANKSVLKQRLMKMPLDDALAALKSAGIDAQPVTTNPELLRQWSLNNAYRALRFKELGDYLKAENLIKFVKTGSDPPDGYLPLSDRRFQIYFRADQGLVKAGQYYASVPVTRLMDRAISKGLEGKWPFNELRNINNVWNQVNLGFSAFHAMETAANSSMSDLALAIRQASVGRFPQAAKSVARGLMPLASPISQLVKGHQFRKAVLRADPVALQVLDGIVNKGGARLTMENRYRSTSIANFKHALANNSPTRLLANALPAAGELFGKLLMEVAIPRIKIGAYLDLASEVSAQMPTAGSAARAEAYGKAWDSIDNRLGMLTYDNLHWNRTAVDLLQFAFRSLGWNHGTELELGGGIKDIGQLVKRGVVTDRLAYTVVLPMYVALIGAFYQLAHTGKWPAELKDYFYPKNGLQDPSGNPDRVSLKSYMSDAINFYRNPVRTVEHKIAPLPEWATSMIRNENYFGDLIRNPDDPVAKQLAQVGQFTYEQWIPLSWNQVKGLSSEGMPLEQSVERGLAIQKAPPWAIKSQLQQEAEKRVAQRLGERHRTPEEVEIDTLKRTARIEFKTMGLKSPAIAELLKRGVFHTREQALNFMKTTATKTPIQRTLESLPMADRVELIRKYGIHKPQ